MQVDRLVDASRNASRQVNKCKQIGWQMRVCVRLEMMRQGGICKERCAKMEEQMKRGIPREGKGLSLYIHIPMALNKPKPYPVESRIPNRAVTRPYRTTLVNIPSHGLPLSRQERAPPLSLRVVKIRASYPKPRNILRRTKGEQKVGHFISISTQ